MTNQTIEIYKKCLSGGSATTQVAAPRDIKAGAL